jgi:GT2 family glycosyltransferase/glycosyltransferase involved in cell wall biosynthesis
VAAQFARLGHRVFWISPSRYLPPNSEQPFEALPLRDNVWEVRLRGERPDLYGGHVTDEEADNVECSIAQLYRSFDISESCALLQFPYWRQAGLRLRETFGAKIVYDCMDDWQNWTAEPRISSFNLEEEKKLARECDLLVVSSTGLGDRHLAAGHQPLLVRNGADFDFFANPRDQQNEIPKPVVGYYGAIANWFDVELLTAVAESRPQYSFVLIGQVHQIDVSRLQNLSNVYFLGEKSYREIPSYLANFDTALIPFRVNELTRAVDPVKLYEYLSQGKPVVATRMAELEQAAELIQIADNAEDFARKLDVAMGDKDPARRAKRIEFARANTWAARVAEIDRVISGRFPLVSILIVTFNCHEFVEPCLDSVERNTSWPNYEVILVDNHSTDGSAEIADQLAGANPKIRVIHSPENLGFAGANNLAAKSAQGDYLVFLNPDTVVTPGWVGRMVRHYETTPSVGAVAAVTNFSGNETKINFEYHDVLEMENFALKLAADRAGESLEIPMAPLYCVLVSRAVWNQVGELDEEFEVGMFEDDDFSLRLKNAGYRILAAEDCFIHHFGNGSFSKLPSEEAILRFERNQQRFESKWKMSWRAHTLRPKVRSPYDEIRLTPEEFYQVGSAVAAPRQREPMVLRRLHPAGTTAGTAFNPQPGGEAAIVVECSNVTPGTVVVMGSKMLVSSYGKDNLISALVPRDLYAQAGRVPVQLLNDFGESNTVEFEVHGPE